VGRKKQQQQQEETLFNLAPYTYQPGYWEAEDENTLSAEYNETAIADMKREQKSTPVATNSVQRVYFSEEEAPNDESTPVAREIVQRVYFWVETYIMRRRYLHYRFCHLRSVDGIKHAVKVHIPGRGQSIREGRAQVVKDAIASGKSLGEIEQLIRGWRA
jgi:hypothetical protein